jgi:hypothetical protein
MHTKKEDFVHWPRTRSSIYIEKVSLQLCWIDEETGFWIPETFYAFFDRETKDYIM